MTEQEHDTGRRAVRTHLIEPLQADGMVRNKRTTVEAHKAFLDRLVDKLAYMTADNLIALRPVVAGLGEGKGLDIWPSLQAITAHAYRMQPPPDQSDEILWSWLHSIEGPKCRALGTLFATRAFIKKFRKPPVGDFQKGRVAERQAEINRDLEEMRRLRGLGEATDSQLAALAEYERILGDCEAIVDAGIRYRETKGVAA